MLKLDEEVILNSLLKIKDRTGSNEITGSYEDFPVKYQICYKEIIERLEAKNYIKNFYDYGGENFVLTLQPSSLESFLEQAVNKNTVTPSTPSNETHKESQQNITDHSIETRIKAIENIIAQRGGSDKEELKSLMEEVKELCENLKGNPTIQPHKSLIKRIVEINKTHPWVYTEVIKIFGVTMVEIMSGK